MYGLYVHHYTHSSVRAEREKKKEKRVPWQMALLTAYGLVLESSERCTVCSVYQYGQADMCQTDRPIYQPSYKKKHNTLPSSSLDSD